MIRGLTYLIGFQVVGELVVRIADVPVPGAVVGMLLCFAWLRRTRAGDDTALVRAGSGLLRHLQLLFVPAGVGIVAYLSTLRADALPISVALVGSWLLGLVAVAWTAIGLERLTGAPHDDLPAPDTGTAR
ncbi:CidA/LrgA family protein [Nocardioides sambongensis]|uniref:CidA/LrgA family protein n=1 Tax=Nocardioides sambongensis TaxID=2589074 RepID=UPI00112B774E|nr:CidA/LrgA family protein [Nocardioides sambongensis]